MARIETRDLVIWVLIGLLAGWLAHFVLPTEGGLIAYLVSGLLGSIVGPLVLRIARIELKLGSAVADQIVASVIGAIIVVLVGMLVT